jgi:catechol 2,3-dioxygenase-like lactoylglutathione lyase family enzyme
VTVKRMDHVGVVVDDMDAAKAFFAALGLEVQGQGEVEGRWVDGVVGLDGVQVEYAMVDAPGGQGRLELVKFNAPQVLSGDGQAPANTLGIRHVAFEVDDIDAAVATVRAHGGELVGDVENYEDLYRLCYVRGPERIIVELAQRIG